MYLENVALREEPTGGLRCPPQSALRIPVDLAAVTEEGVYVLYVPGGDVHVAHVRRIATARRGAIMTIDGTAPARIQVKGKSAYDILTLEIPAARLSTLRRTEKAGSGLHRIPESSSSPLAACVKLLAQHMHTATQPQIAALYEACVALLVAEESRFESVVEPRETAVADNPLLRAILAFADRNICDPALAPAAVASRLGISVRYLHKVFAASGVTFGAYVVMRRLDQVRTALISGEAATRTIAELAHAAGFRDISAFNRAFRKRFGCTPRRLRTRAAT